MPARPLKICAGSGCDATTYSRYCDRCRRRNCQVYLVIGPSGSGKSTWVRQNAKRGDLVIDFDLLFQAVSLQPMFEKPANLVPFVLAARDAMLQLVGSNDGTRAAYVIRNKITRQEIDEFRAEFGAKVVLFKVSAAECIRRLEADTTRPAGQLAEWRARVHEWWAEHRGLDIT